MAFPDNQYAPPGVYTRTNTENPIQTTFENIKIPVLIGEGNEYLTQRNLEVVRGSSSTIDQKIAKEDMANRAVLSSSSGSYVLGAWDGSVSSFRVRNYPIVTGDGTGTTTTNRADVQVTINGNVTIVRSVNGATGVITLATSPKPGDDVRCSYFFKRTDTQFTDDVSSQVTSTAAIIYAETGVADVDSPAYDSANPQYVVITDDVNVANNVLSLVVDGSTYTITLPANPNYTVRQVANVINAAGAGSLVASAFFNNYGQSALKLTADHELKVLSGNANAPLGLADNQISVRTKTFYVFEGPIVDGSNSGITTTSPLHVSVKVDGVTVVPTAVDGATRAVTLPLAPKAGAVVKITYYANTWQDTFDYLAHNGVIELLSCGDTPDSSTYVLESDVVLSNDKVYWGSAWNVAAGVHTSDTEYFDSTQVSGTLVDDRTFLTECASTTTPRVYQTAFAPKLGNGRDTSLGSSLYQSASNDRIDVPANRPDVVQAYWGYGVQDALNRGPVTVLRVEGSLVTLAADVPVGATVYTTNYYNQLTDASYTLTANTIGPSSVGTYSVTDADGTPVLVPQFNTSSKGSGLTGISLVFPSGSELLPDFRMESGTPVPETVTVQFAAEEATPAKYAVPGAGPYYFIDSQSDKARVVFNGNELAAGAGGLDLTYPVGISSWDGGFFASVVGEEVNYTGGSGATVGQSYTLDSDETVVLTVDGIQVEAPVEAASNVTISHYADAINLASKGIQATAAAGSTNTTLVLPASTIPGDAITNHFVGWNIVLGYKLGQTTVAGNTRTITAYDAATRTATVAAWSGGASPAALDPFRLYNPATLPTYVASTKFDSNVTVAAGAYDTIKFAYSGSTSGASGALTATLTPGTYTVSTLAAEVQTQLNTQLATLGNNFKGVQIYVKVGADNQLRFQLQVGGLDDSGLLTFFTYATPAMDFCILAGIDTAASAGQGQTTLVVSNIARVYSMAHASGMRPHDRLILRSHLLPGGGGSMAADSFLSYAGIVVGAGSGNTKSGLVANTVGVAGYTATVRPATLASSITFASGQDGTSQEPLVYFYNGSPTVPDNDFFSFVFDGVPVTFSFTSSAGGTATALGPATTSGTVLYQIADALGSAIGLSAAAVVSAGYVKQEGCGIRLTSATDKTSSYLSIGNGNANSSLGFLTGSSAYRTPVSARKLMSAFNSNRHTTFATMCTSFNSYTANYFTAADMGIASVVRDANGAEYLYLQSLPSVTGGYGTLSTIALRDPTNSVDTWLSRGTGINAINLDGAQGEAAISGFFVTSSNPNGSGSANTSKLNDGVGQDGIVGQTYRDSVTGLAFTILPRGWFDNQLGPWTAYPTGASATFQITVSSSVTTNANLPVRAVPGLELKVANTTGIGAGDTATVKTFARSGLEPKVGDTYYVSYTYMKDDYSIKFFTKMSAIEAQYGSVSPSNPVSLAAYIAMLNGAPVVGIKQVLREEGSDLASLQSYRDAITELEDVLPGQVNPDIIIPLRGDSLELFQFLKTSNEKMSSIRYKSERTSIIGVSAGTTPSDAAAYASALNSDRMRLVYPDIATVQLTDSTGVVSEFLVDGPMIAVALAGSVVSPTYDVASPWTGRLLSGFTGLARNMNAVEMNNTAQKGVIVLESRGRSLRVRDGLTTKVSDNLSKLPTVRLVADEVQRQSRQLLDSYIGVKLLPNVLTSIEGRLAMLLKSLVQQEIIVAYRNVKAKVSADDPTVVEVEAAYSPVLPLRYIVITFTLRSNL